jgi:polyhydroxyalkanoate synthesis regulator phasin
MDNELKEYLRAMEERIAGLIEREQVRILLAEIESLRKRIEKLEAKP